MKKCCKKCSKFSICNYFVPFPERGCSEFESKIFLFAIVLCNTETGKTDILNIHDDLSLANAELHDLSENICKRPSSHIKLSIRPFLYDDAKKIADKLLISIVNIVAFDLSAADRGFRKGIFKTENFEKFSRWFDFASNACRRGAAILDVIL